MKPQIPRKRSMLHCRRSAGSLNVMWEGEMGRGESARREMSVQNVEK